MKVSVVISTFNGEKYIVDQLESIRMQTHSVDEVLICDDCSTDNTVNIIRQYILKNGLNNWFLKVNDINVGWEKNFYNLIYDASGDIVFLCDQDDVWNIHKVEIMHNVMNRHDNINVLVSDYLEFYNELPDISILNSKKIKTKSIMMKQNFFKCGYPGCTYCVRKTFIYDIKKCYNREWPHDGTFWRFSMCTGGLYKVKCILFYYRKHRDSTFQIVGRNMKSLNAKINWVNYAIEFSEKLKNFLSDNKYSSEKNIKIIEEYIKCQKTRKNFFETKKIYYGLKLVKYLKFYNSIKQFLGDFFLVYIKSDLTAIFK